MKKLVYVLFFFIFTVHTENANAFMIEPYANYAISTGGELSTTWDAATPLDFDADYNTPNLGLRTGFTFLWLMLGLEYTHYAAHTVDITVADSGSWTWETVNVTDTSFKASRNALGITAGFYSFIAFWATYYPMANMKISESSYPDFVNSGDTLDGNGAAAGIGFSILPFLMIRAEYRTFSYEDKNQESDAVAGTGLTYDFESSEILLGISAPITF